MLKQATHLLETGEYYTFQVGEYKYKILCQVCQPPKFEFRDFGTKEGVFLYTEFFLMDGLCLEGKNYRKRGGVYFVSGIHSNMRHVYQVLSTVARCVLEVLEREELNELQILFMDSKHDRFWEKFLRYFDKDVTIRREKEMNATMWYVKRKSPGKKKV